MSYFEVYEENRKKKQLLVPGSLWNHSGRQDDKCYLYEIKRVSKENVYYLVTSPMGYLTDSWTSIPTFLQCLKPIID